LSARVTDCGVLPGVEREHRCPCRRHERSSATWAFHRAARGEHRRRVDPLARTAHGRTTGDSLRITRCRPVVARIEEEDGAVRRRGHGGTLDHAGLPSSRRRQEGARWTLHRESVTGESLTPEARTGGGSAAATQERERPIGCDVRRRGDRSTGLTDHRSSRSVDEWSGRIRSRRSTDALRAARVISRREVHDEAS